MLSLNIFCNLSSVIWYSFLFESYGIRIKNIPWFAIITLSLTTTPFNATDTITFSSSATGKATITKIDDRHVEVTGVESGSATISAKVGTTTIASVSVSVEAAS